MARKLMGNGGTDEEDRTRTQSVPGADLEKRAIGFGTTKPGTAAGRQRAVYAEIDLTTVPDLTNVIIRHALGEKPTVCEYVEIRNSGSSVFASIRPVDKHLWTHTTVRVAVNLTGVQPDSVLKVRVGGE